MSAATIGNKFNASMSYSQADIKSNYSVSQFSENVLLSGGTVNATRTVLHSYSILPNGANFTLRFESYDKDGTTTLGENTVAIKYVCQISNAPFPPRSPPNRSGPSFPLNIALPHSRHFFGAPYSHFRADRLKYSAHLSGWNFTAPNHQVRLMIIGAYYSGSYDTPIPTLDQQDWNTSARHLLITWGATGPVLDTLLDTDVWALADDSVANILLAPNPTIDLASNVFGYDYPKYMASTFGYVLPRFSEQLTWDPTLLMSLFSDDPTSRTTNKSNFDRNRNIIIGCVVGGIVLIVLGIVIAALIVKNKNVRDQRSVIHDQSPATLA